MSSFPTSKPDLSDAYVDSTPQATTHPEIHNTLNEELDAVIDKVGIDSSADTTTLDYKLKNASSSNPGHKHTLASGATDITASAAEVNLIDGSVAGTAVASKALSLGANKNVDEFHTAALYLGADAGTAVASSAVELNITDGGETTEKVLNVQSKCRVYLSATQSNVVKNDYVKILFDTESYDVGSDFDTANKRFVAPVTGYYKVDLNLVISGGDANVTYYPMIYVNGALYQQGVTANGAGTTIGGFAGTDAYVVSGQYIEGYVFCVTAGNTADIVSAATNTTMSIHLLSI